MYDDGITCPSGHAVCIDCMRRLIKPCKQNVFTGLCYDCPICRSKVSITPLQNMVLVKGSWRTVEDAFYNAYELFAWVERRVARSRR